MSFLADLPSGLAGDANKDGVRSSFQDEFVELLNTDIEEDISLWSIWDGSALRHQFPPSTLLSPYERFVIFGGGSLNNFEGLAALASSGSLSLNNAGDQIVLKNNLGEIVDQVAFSSEADKDQSLTRYPERTGLFQLHSRVSSENLLFSPGADPEGQRSSKTPATPEPITTLLVSVGFVKALWRKRTRD